MNPGGREWITRPTINTPTPIYKKYSKKVKMTLDSVENSEEDEPIEQVQKVNDYLSRPKKTEGIGGSSVM